MPADNIKRAIQRGTGELPGATYEEFLSRATARVVLPSCWISIRITVTVP